MNSNIERAMGELTKNEELLRNFFDAKDLDEKYEILKPFSDGLSFEEFKNEFTFKEPLTFDDLEEIAGGITDFSEKTQGIILDLCASSELINAVLDNLPANKRDSTTVQAIKNSIQRASMEAAGATNAFELGKALASGIIDGLVTAKIIDEGLGSAIRALMSMGITMIVRRKM